MIALIDADIIVYWASNHCQTNYYDVVDKDNESIKEYDSKRHALDGLEDINALWQTQAIEGEESPYRVIQGKIVLEPWAECVEFINDFIDSVVNKSKSTEYELHLSGHTNFRKEIAVTKPYKGNRKGEKPFYYQKVRDYLTEVMNADMTPTEMKAAAFNRVVNDSSIPMDQRITAALRRETGAAFNPEEGIAMRAKLEAMDAERRNATGAGMTPNEMRMFMGIPQ